MGPRLAIPALLALSFAVPPAASESVGLPLPVCHAEEIEATGVFAGVGVVTAIDDRTGALTLDHEDIVGLMPAMEMMYRVKSPSLAHGIAVGDKVRFTLDARSYTLLTIEKLGTGK